MVTENSHGNEGFERTFGGLLAGRKRESGPAYRELINDEWASFLEAMFEKGKLGWSYNLSDNEKDVLLTGSDTEGAHPGKAAVIAARIKKNCLKVVTELHI